MCGRYSLAVDTKQLALHFKVDVVATEWVPTFSVAPSELVPIVRERADQRGLTQATWGVSAGMGEGGWASPNQCAS